MSRGQQGFLPAKDWGIRTGVDQSEISSHSRIGHPIGGWGGNVPGKPVHALHSLQLAPAPVGYYCRVNTMNSI
jgi:hypothetical protein